MRLVLADVPLSCEKGEPTSESPNLGLLFLASFIRDKLPDWEIFYFEPWLTREEHIKKLKAVNPDVYGLSFTTFKRDSALALLWRVHQEAPNALLIAGGVHPTVDPEDVLQHSPVSFIIKGEGENALLHLLSNLGKQETSKIISGGLLENIDFMPAWDMVDFKHYSGPVCKHRPFAYVLCSRGCPFNCVFCSSPVWKLSKPWVRTRSPQNIASEIKALYALGVREIYLRDDTFNSDLSWTYQVIDAIKSLRLPDLAFQCQLRTDKVTVELAKKLKDLGCWLVHLGIESSSNRVLEGVHKQTTIENALGALTVLKSQGLKTYGFFMIYNAWEKKGELNFETSEEVAETYNLVSWLLKKKLLDFMSWAIANPLPGSELNGVALRHDLLAKKGLLPLLLPLSKKDMWHWYQKGITLHLKNGLVKGLFGFRYWRRISRKMKVLTMRCD